MTEEQTRLVGRTFRHFKGNLYRLARFVAGIILMSLGVALSVHSNLGTTPISTFPVAVNVWNARVSVADAPRPPSPDVDPILSENCGLSSD